MELCGGGLPGPRARRDRGRQARGRQRRHDRQRLNLANGFQLPNGIRLSNGLRLSNGIHLQNGILLANGNQPGERHPARERHPPRERRDADRGDHGPLHRAGGEQRPRAMDRLGPENNLRLLKYLVQCAWTRPRRWWCRSTAPQHRFTGSRTSARAGESVRWSWPTRSRERLPDGPDQRARRDRVDRHRRALPRARLGPLGRRAGGLPLHGGGFLRQPLPLHPRGRSCSASVGGSSRPCLRADGSCDCGILNVRGPCEGRSQYYGYTFTCEVAPAGYYTQCSTQGPGGMVEHWAHPVTTWTTLKPNDEPCSSSVECISGRARQVLRAALGPRARPTRSVAPAGSAKNQCSATPRLRRRRLRWRRRQCADFRRRWRRHPGERLLPLPQLQRPGDLRRQRVRARACRHVHRQ